jgi:pyruvate/2-oxoglutarate dehydrogenase complex dihydrolipoamide acyltransferase (E2) component
MALLQEIQVPLLAVNDTSLTVVEINFSRGSKVKKGDLIMVFETSKTTYDVEAEAEGYIQYLCETNGDYAVSEVVARIYSEAAEAEVIPAASSHGQPAGPSFPQKAGSIVQQTGPSFPQQTGRAFPQPAGHSLPQPAGPRSDVPLPPWEGETLFSEEAARLVAASGIGPAVFAGWDFVSKWDVLEVARISPGAAGTKSPKTAPAKMILPADPAKVILEKLTSGKRREIEYLSEVQSTGLISTLHIFVETDNIFTFINRSLKYLKDSLLPVVIYEAARLLTDYPLLNAYFTGEAIACYREINPGFAIDIDKGLKVLKIARAEQKSIPEIEQAILQLSGSYLDDALQIEDLTDITFTITDLSSEGVAFFRPLINKMNSSILGISAIDEKLQRCTLSLTFDHRVTEGKLAARYLKELKDRLESYRATDPVFLSQAIACFKCYKTLKEDLAGTGFARCITPEGKEGYICQSCLKGF